MQASSRGVTAGPATVAKFIAHCVKLNTLAAQENKMDRKVVPCVWGPAGIAKTSMFKQLETVGIEIDGELVFPKVIHVALAQIEEAGDLTGLPIVQNNDQAEAITNYAPPQWWPTDEDAKDPKTGKERPVILLIDDFNRADPRILKAIMQLLQDYGTNTRSLPPSTTIGLTGNPPTGDDDTEYMVNEIDKAILTRMLHISMKFNKTDWGVWAERTGVDPRVQSFVFAYEEMCNGTTGERTNPRSITQFANLISTFKDLKANEEMVMICAKSCLDDAVANAFWKFAIGDMQLLVEPAEILSSWKTAEKKLESLKKRKSGKDGESKLRADIIGIIADRMYVYLMQPELAGKLEKKEYEGFLQFIKRTDLIPEDCMYTLLRRLRRDATSKAQQQMFTDLIRHGGPEIADLIMNIS